ncbi:hypothetical protein AK812_SmicGene32881 [Symbiodinium microadriaticum]|uniref:Uncharacterized protein n=1 Tax=Symbiodinium microadriaticum TaxID=2951 RepID=A0A1Q9CT43_SYMMI|nr:hypothetical protein AK812_SmicGene32881 [Symbiodinium microadriaticum]
MFEKGPVRDEFATVEWIMSSSEKKTCLEVLVAGFASSSWGAEARERLFVSLDFPVMLLSHRLEQKLTTVPAVDEPLPAGLERSSSRNCFLVDGNSLRSENLPPRGGTVVGSPSTLLNQAGTKEALHVNLAELKELKVELLQFDEQTQFDVKEFRRRIAEADKELLGLLRSSAEFRMEVEDAESAWKNKQAYRKALMDAVQVAVDSARPSEPMEAAPQELVADCREKLQRLQIEILEDERRRQARLAEFNELCEDIAELKEVKQRSMLQLQSFLELRDQQRQGRLKNAVAQLMPLAPVDLNRSLVKEQAFNLARWGTGRKSAEMSVELREQLQPPEDRARQPCGPVLAVQEARNTRGLGCGNSD